jgi:CRISPR-associated protein Cas2
MHKLIFYDIEDDKVRTKLAKVLESMGLVRIQKSVFVGTGSAVYWSKVIEKMTKKLKELLLESDTVCFLAIEERSLKQAILFGNTELFSTFEELKKEYLIL